MSSALDRLTLDGALPESMTIPDDLSGLLGEQARVSDRTGEPSAASLEAVRGSGLTALAVPEAFGGLGGDAVAVNRCVERVAVADPSMAIILFQHFAVCARINEWGDEAQRARLLPALADGQMLAASAWSETGAGADKKNLATTATRLDDGDWHLQGAKSFTTGAGLADLYLVLAQSGSPGDGGADYGAAGQSFFLVPAGLEGVEPDLGLDLAGMRGSATGFIALPGCRVPDEMRLGEEGTAARIIAGVRESGATLGAVSVGIAQAALDLLVAHARKRGTVTVPAVAHRLVELGLAVEAARGLVERAGARTADDPGTVTLYSKIFASECAERVCSEVSRALGSAGFVAEHPINRLIRDARALALMGPTNDLCRELVSKQWN